MCDGSIVGLEKLLAGILSSGSKALNLVTVNVTQAVASESASWGTGAWQTGEGTIDTWCIEFAGTQQVMATCLLFNGSFAACLMHSPDMCSFKYDVARYRLLHSLQALDAAT